MFLKGRFNSQLSSTTRTGFCKFVSALYISRFRVFSKPTKNCLQSGRIHSTAKAPPFSTLVLSENEICYMILFLFSEKTTTAVFLYDINNLCIFMRWHFISVTSSYFFRAFEPFWFAACRSLGLTEVGNCWEKSIKYSEKVFVMRSNTKILPFCIEMNACQWFSGLVERASGM